MRSSQDGGVRVAAGQDDGVEAARQADLAQVMVLLLLEPASHVNLSLSQVNLRTSQLQNITT